MTGPQQKALTFDGINALILKYKENGDPVDPAEVGRAAQSKDPQDIRSTLTNAYTSGACGSGSISIVT